MRFGDIPDGVGGTQEEWDRAGRVIAEGKRKKEMEKIPGDPNDLAGESEHSHQVALFAALAQYEYGFRELAKCTQMAALFYGNEESKNGSPSWAEWPSAQAMFDEGERLGRLAETIKWIHSIPNGGSRGNDKRSAMIQGANLKAEGQKRGVSDICINVARQGYRCFYIEMKAPELGGELGEGKLVLRGPRKGEYESGESDEQIAFGKWIVSEGGLYGVFYHWKAALRAIMWYLGFEHDKRWSLD